MSDVREDEESPQAVGSKVPPPRRQVRAKPAKTFPSGRAALIFGVTTAVLAVAAVGGVFLMAVLNRPYVAVTLMGSSMIAAGLLRAVWPGSPWFSARNKWLDVAVFLAVGAALLYLAPWTSAVAPG